MEKRMLELYIHIPFCVKKCNYCDFLSAPGTIPERKAYVEKLLSRIQEYGELAEGSQVTSIFLGGGTPSVLEATQTREILIAIRQSFQVSPDAEITTELNPGTADRKKLLAYKEMGMNRLSIGLQSTWQEELRLLGRIHTYEDFLKVYEEARGEGFGNINVDLMSALPGQTLESYEATLRRIGTLQPEHISAYSLIVEEGTPFYEQYGTGKGLPDEETERRMYERTKEILEEYGYYRYEISNYAKPGYACRHNLGYWDRTEYLGIGAGASSLFRHCRFQEPQRLPEKLSGAPRSLLETVEGMTRLTQREEIEEFLFLGLRQIEGVSKGRFKKEFGKPLEFFYQKVIEQLVSQELIEETKEMLRLTERGIDLSNYVLSQFLLDEK